MGYQDVAFMPSTASSIPHFINTVVKVKASGPPHVSKNCGRGQARACFLQNTFTPTNPLSVSVDFQEDHKAVTKMRPVWPPSVLGTLPDVKQWCLLRSVNISASTQYAQR